LLTRGYQQDVSQLTLRRPRHPKSKRETKSSRHGRRTTYFFFGVFLPLTGCRADFGDSKALGVEQAAAGESVVSVAKGLVAGRFGFVSLTCQLAFCACKDLSTSLILYSCSGAFPFGAPAMRTAAMPFNIGAITIFTRTELQNRRMSCSPYISYFKHTSKYNLLITVLHAQRVTPSICTLYYSCSYNEDNTICCASSYSNQLCQSM
jgi:hypothetical protein